MLPSRLPSIAPGYGPGTRNRGNHDGRPPIQGNGDPAQGAGRRRELGVVAETLGFIGLGHMGGPMSGRLVAAGHHLIGFDGAGTQERLPADALAAASSADVAARADTVLLSLPDGDASRAV